MSAHSTVLLTGVTGYIGSHTAIQLLNRGYRVIGTLRSVKRKDAIRQTLGAHTPNIDQLELAVADLSRAEDWPPLVAKVDSIFHIASPVPLKRPKDENAVIQPAMQGVEHIFRAAQQTNVSRIILTSSIAAACYGKDRFKTFTEEDWSDPENRKDHSAYTRSKTYAERLAWELANQAEHNIQLTTILPGLVIGPVLEKDYGVSATLVKRLMDGSTPAMPKLGIPMVDVRSVAEMHILALENEASIGHRIFATDQFTYLHEVAETLRIAFPDYRIPKLRVPDWILHLAAIFDSELSQVKFEINAERRTDNQKARKLLGWHPIPLERSILDTAQSMIHHGIV
ncbi:MAG: NAD-dependent epimerase/dehydratase family protein [Bacteroidota bacterium]